jgi:hypothetical protein
LQFFHPHRCPVTTLSPSPDLALTRPGSAIPRLARACRDSSPRHLFDHSRTVPSAVAQLLPAVRPAPEAGPDRSTVSRSHVTRSGPTDSCRIRCPGPDPSKHSGGHSTMPALTPGCRRPLPTAVAVRVPLPAPARLRARGVATATAFSLRAASDRPSYRRSAWLLPPTPGSRSPSQATVAAPCHSQPLRDCGPAALPLPLPFRSERRQTARATATVRDSLPIDLGLPRTAAGDRSGVLPLPAPTRLRARGVATATACSLRAASDRPSYRHSACLSAD